MRAFIYILLFIPIIGIAQDRIELNDGFKINAYVSNGFYDIGEIKYANYKSEGLQLSYGVHLTYFPSKKIGFRLITGYTADDFHLQNYIEGGNYWEEPTWIKSMAYVDFGGLIQYNLVLHEKFQMSFSGGYITGYLIKGNDVLTGIYGPNYPYYFRGPSKQFRERVFSYVLSSSLSYSYSKKFAIEIEPMTRIFTEDFSKNMEDNTPPINLLIGVSYRINYPQQP